MKKKVKKEGTISMPTECPRDYVLESVTHILSQLGVYALGKSEEEKQFLKGIERTIYSIQDSYLGLKYPIKSGSLNRLCTRK